MEVSTTERVVSRDQVMLKQARAGATLPAQDMERAKAWYSEKLGLTPAGADQFGAAAYELAEGTGFALFQSAGRPSGTHTQLGFDVDDVPAMVKVLKARGVTFEEYNSPPLVTVDGVAQIGEVKGAWFKDSEGNLLAIGTRTPATARRN